MPTSGSRPSRSTESQLRSRPWADQAALADRTLHLELDEAVEGFGGDMEHIRIDARASLGSEMFFDSVAQGLESLRRTADIPLKLGQAG